jgi:hypothetical protein
LRTTSEQLKAAITQGLQAVVEGLCLPLKFRTFALEKSYAAELRELDQLNRQFGDTSLAMVCLNVHLYVNMLLNAPSLASALAIVSSVFQRLNVSPKDTVAGMGAGLLGLMRGNMEIGSRMDDEASMRRQVDMDAMQQGLVQVFSGCDFSAPNFNSVSDLCLIFNCLNMHSRKMCLRSVLQNTRYFCVQFTCTRDLVFTS